MLPLDVGGGVHGRYLANKSTEQQVEITSWTTGVLVFLVVLWALFGPKLGRLHLTEGSAACIFGLLCGGLLLAGRHYFAQQAVVQRLLAFSAASFFTYLLPPVIFYAGLSIEKTLFFRNLGSILALGVLGTAVSAVVLAALLAAGFAGLRVLRIQDCLALGAIFSATDSVATLQVLNPERQPTLFALVFGEGVINDATSVVLLGAVSAMFPSGGTPVAGSPPDPDSGGWSSLGGIALTFCYLFFTSLVLGAATGSAISCLVVRFAAHGPHHEVALIGLLSYLSYLAAEVLGLSGILSLFCCGLTVSQFGLDNISEVGRTTTLNAFHTMSYICEGIIFIYLGMDALDPAKWHAAHPGEVISLCGALLLLLLVSRAISVLPITAIHNWLHPVKLTSTDVVIVWWSGLMRGAVSVALAYYYFDIGAPTGSTGDRHYSTLIVSTLVVVLVTVVIMGAATQPLLQVLVDDPELSVLEKTMRKMRGWQHHATGCAAASLHAICCCLSGRGPRGPLGFSVSLPKRDSNGPRGWWGREPAGGRAGTGFQPVSTSDEPHNDTDGNDVSGGRGDQRAVLNGVDSSGADVELGGMRGASNGVLNAGHRDMDRMGSAAGIALVGMSPSVVSNAKLAEAAGQALPAVTSPRQGSSSGGIVAAASGSEWGARGAQATNSPEGVQHHSAQHHHGNLEARRVAGTRNGEPGAGINVSARRAVSRAAGEGSDTTSNRSPLARSTAVAPTAAEGQAGLGLQLTQSQPPPNIASGLNSATASGGGAESEGGGKSTTSSRSNARGLASRSLPKGVI